MKYEIKNEIERLLQILHTRQRQGFLTIPQASMALFNETKASMKASVESGEKTKDEAKAEFEAFFANLKNEVSGMDFVINLRDPDTNEILVEDCTVADFEFFLNTGELIKENN